MGRRITKRSVSTPLRLRARRRVRNIKLLTRLNKFPAGGPGYHQTFGQFSYRGVTSGGHRLANIKTVRISDEWYKPYRTTVLLIETLVLNDQSLKTSHSAEKLVYFST